MIEKRFRISQGYSDKFCHDWEKNKLLNFRQTVDLLNNLNDENEELKQSYTKLEHRHSLLHDECLDAECDRDSYQKDVSSLEKENEQLKKDCTALICSNQEYRKENEQLKQFIKQNCPMCRANLELFYKEWRCEND